MNRPSIPFTAEEDARLRKAIADGLNYPEMIEAGLFPGRTIAMLRQRGSKMGLKQCREAWVRGKIRAAETRRNYVDPTEEEIAAMKAQIHAERVALAAQGSGDSHREPRVYRVFGRRFR